MYTIQKKPARLMIVARETDVYGYDDNAPLVNEDGEMVRRRDGSVVTLRQRMDNKKRMPRPRERRRPTLPPQAADQAQESSQGRGRSG